MKTRSQKLFWMFAPLGLLFALVGVTAYDMSHPHQESLPCKVLATGMKASTHRTPDNVLYTSSGQKTHDVALACAERGVLVINDFDVFVTAIDPGDQARLSRRDYQWLPTRWSVDIYHK